MSEHPRCPRDGGLLLMERGVNGAPDRVFCELCGWSVYREVVPRVSVDEVKRDWEHTMALVPCTVIGCTNKILPSNTTGLCHKHGNQMQMYKARKSKTAPFFKTADGYVENPEYGRHMRKGRAL